MKCSGPCEGGNKACPTPWACEVSEPSKHDMVKIVLQDLAVSIAVLATFAVVVLWALGEMA